MTEYRLRLEHDEGADSPDEFDNESVFLVTRPHRDFAPKNPKGWTIERVLLIAHENLGECQHCDHKIQLKEGRWIDDYSEGAICCETGEEDGLHEPRKVDDRDDYAVFPLRAYIHSGVALSLDRSYPFDDQWDSMSIGFVVVRIADFNKEQDLGAVAKSYVETWNQYLSGDVWVYLIERIETCDLGHEHAEVVDSCGGLYGEKYAREEGEIALKHHTEQQVVPPDLHQGTT